MPARPAVPKPPSRASLAVLTALGLAVALWSFALFLGPSAAAVKTICGPDDGGGCGALWRSPFALSVQRVTGVSVAGWGVVWGVAAAALAAACLRRPSKAGGPPAAQLTGLRFLSAAGLVGVFVLLGVSAGQRTFCAACAVAHSLVVAHAAIALFSWRARGLPEAARGLMLAAALVLASYVVVVFIPGAARETAAFPAAPAGADRSEEEALAGFVASLPPPGRQALSDVLDRMRRGPALTLPSPHGLRGPADAAVRFTEFTDVRCSHCAELHRVWEELERAVPAGRFSVESRFYPLDRACNPDVRNPKVDPVRCLAPRVQVCLEGRPGARDLAGALFAEQASLTPERVYALAVPYAASRRDLEACVASEQTAVRLAEDVALARQYEPEGTPIVLVNGRLGSAFPPFLYAITLSHGSPDHPAFAGLPPPDPDAHIH
jgi:protein-disulfide isomerase